MDNFVKFCARGHNFILQNNLLEKHPQSMLYMLNECKNAPVDKINGYIYLDINPFSVSDVIDHINIGANRIASYYTIMDLKYLGLISNDNCNDISFENNMKLVEKTNMEANLDKSKLYKVHTADSKILIISVASFDNNNLNAIANMFYVDQNKENMEDKYVNAWTNMTERIFNLVMSVMRDGISVYYNFFSQKHEDANLPSERKTYGEHIVFEECCTDKSDYATGNAYEYSGYKFGCGCKVVGTVSKYGKHCMDCLYRRQNEVCKLTSKNSIFALKDYVNNCVELPDEQASFNRDITKMIKHMAEKLDNDYNKNQIQICNMNKLILDTMNIEENKKVLQYIQAYFNIE